MHSYGRPNEAKKDGKARRRSELLSVLHLVTRKVSRLRVVAEGADELAALALHDHRGVHPDAGADPLPRRQGLRDSYTKESLSILHILAGTMVDYSVFQKFGTSKMAARPHLTPAFLQAEQFFQRRLKEGIDNLG